MRRVLVWTLAGTAAALLACTPSSRGDSPGPAAPTATYTGVNHRAPTPAPSATAIAEVTRGGTMTVQFLDVGQGDSALVTTDDHHAILIDAGPPQGASRVARALEALGSTALDAVLLTHAHADHLGDMGNLARRIPLGRWIDPGFSQHPVHAYAHALSACEARHIPVQIARRGDRFPLGAHADVNVLLPREPLLHGTRSDPNANSVVVRIDHHARPGEARFLFVGDAEAPTERRLLEDPPSLRADVLKVAHHGSRHASTEPMLAAVAPKLAVISCGAGNDYGHPHREALARLEGHRATIARTDVQGDVTVTSDDGGISWVTERPGDPLAMHAPGIQKHDAPEL